jgi:hypothetical protein
VNGNPTPNTQAKIAAQQLSKETAAFHDPRSEGNNANRKNFGVCVPLLYWYAVVIWKKPLVNTISMTTENVCVGNEKRQSPHSPQENTGCENFV